MGFPMVFLWFSHLHPWSFTTTGPNHALLHGIRVQVGHQRHGAALHPRDLVRGRRRHRGAVDWLVLEHVFPIQLGNFVVVGLEDFDVSIELGSFIIPTDLDVFFSKG